MGIKLDLGLSRFPKTARHDELIGVAYQRMLKGGYRHLPVLDNDANLVGIISDRDFQRAKCPSNQSNQRSIPWGVSGSGSFISSIKGTI